MDNQFKAMESLMSGDSGKGVCFQIKEANKLLVDNRLYREMAIRCNDWTLRDWRLHLSWSTGSFIPIEARHIQAGAYCHRKGNISNNPKI